MTVGSFHVEDAVDAAPAGLRAGENVEHYPQLSIKLPPEIKAKLPLFH